MSKLYKRYNELKATNDNQLYLFKSGMFFIFLDNDAKLISNELNLKLTKLNDNIVKCGFPINSFEKYSNLLKERGFEFSIIDENSSIVTSTSNYLNNIEIVNMINKGNVESWARNGWRASSGEEVKMKALWKRLYAFMSIHKNLK